MKKFNNPLDPNDDNIKTAIKKWTVDLLTLNADSDIEILEHLCTDSSCLHAETVVKVHDTEGVRLFKIAKPLTFIRKMDVQNMQPTNLLTSAHKH